MEGSQFDLLAKSFSAAGTRRGLVRLLAALPLGLTFTAVMGSTPDATAEDDDHGSSNRRHRRKAKHRHRTGKDKENRTGERKGKDTGKKPCTPQTAAAACGSQTCGTAVNTCGQTVECTGCAGCCAGNTCLAGDSGAACGKQGAACTNCASGMTCVGNGVCATSCNPLSSDPGCPGFCICNANLGGEPAGVCNTAGGPCSNNNCADCAAMGMVCVVGLGECPNHQQCRPPC